MPPIECNLPELDAAVEAPTGSLRVLNWAGKTAALSYTFDDGNQTQITNYGALNALGVPFSFYLTTNWGGASNAVWTQAVTDGHEIGNHSHTHAENGTASELDSATQFIETRLGVKPLTMAAPYGNTSYSPLAATRFLFNRGVGGGSIAPSGNVDRYNLPTYIPPANASKATMDQAVNSAVSRGHWQTVLVHGFVGGNDGAFQAVPLADFLAHVEGQRDSGKVWIDTLLNVGAYFLGQKLVSGATPSVQGANSTWSWTLPEHFPEGRCLRVVSSGTVSQQGAALTKHPLGYYDVALDAGELTVSSP